MADGVGSVIVCIIGHGPSLIGRKMGDHIDAYDIVVRMKGCGSVLGTEDYGSRVDHLCMTTEVQGLAKAVLAGSYWLYPKNGKYDELQTFEAIADHGAPFMIPKKLMNHWNDEFRKLNPSHPNVSTGMASIIISAHYYEPMEIHLGGFDTLLNPDIEFTRHPDVPRSGFGPFVHDWKAENKLLDKVREAYSLKIVPL